MNSDRPLRIDGVRVSYVFTYDNKATKKTERIYNEENVLKV